MAPRANPWRRRLVLGLVACPLGLAADDAPPEVRAVLPPARLRGTGRMRVLGMHIYDAFLWAGDSFQGFPASALALELRYARALRGRLIAERSLEEMRRGGEIAEDTAKAWLDFMATSFPDVTRGDRITGLFAPTEGASFLFNGKPCGEVRDARFAERFFGIWLAPHTSAPALRESLLGLNRSTSRD